MEKVQRIIQATNSPDPLMKELAATYLEVLGSKAGNDILESMLVWATGREPKSADQKHGADSKDGLVEAKPCKGKYSAHISDDTPMCLSKAQKIPYCILCVTSENGQQIKWAAIVSYRVFDNARYKNICARLELPQAEWPDVLPMDEAARKDILDKLVSAHKSKVYVRSNPLPLECLDGLPPSEYSVWISDELAKKAKLNKEDTHILKLWKAQLWKAQNLPTS